LVVHTDGLVDRDTEVDLARALSVMAPATGPDGVADALLAAADLAGPAQDDVSLVVLRPLPDRPARP
ncbi:MAG: SpoIIE family protein phosphatase, partial [Actinomycetota bacterium]|nr:SpoIIE family protein phosphatase [Actinomycetota bacterium]